MKNTMVVQRPADWPKSEQLEVVSAKTYLRDARFTGRSAGLKVINLSRGFGYQSLAYYVSLLADARRHRVMPTAAITQDVKNRSYLDTIDDELTPTEKRALGEVTDKIVIRVEFGECTSTSHAIVGAKLFRLLRIPIFEATFRPSDGEMCLSRIAIIGDADLTTEERARIFERAQAYLQRRTRTTRTKSYRFDLAILHEPKAVDRPSNARALAKIARAAESMDIRPELIEQDDYNRLEEFDGLFVRATTQVNHYTYRFARRAQAQGIVVMDDPDSILRCTNKVFLAELLAAHRVPHPETRIITREEVTEAAAESTFPVVLKKPDGSFSLGSYKVHDREDFERRAMELLANSELILAQPFLKSDFDWRIGVLDGKPLFACRYFMAKGHWQIINRIDQREVEGDHQTIAVEEAPPAIVAAAVAASKLIGDGLYGVDLKEIDGKAVVIEVNDNPNIDAGVEDQVLKDELYDRIMAVFLARMVQVKAKRGDT